MSISATTRELGTSAAVGKRARLTTFTAYTALGRVVFFFAFHIYWYCGGSLASPGDLPPLVPGHASGDAVGSARTRVQVVAWIVEVPVDAGWPIGAVVCLAMARGWARVRLVRTTQVLVRVGCAVLLLRGFSGILDDVTRSTGLLRDGIPDCRSKRRPVTRTSGGPTGRSTPTSWPADSSSCSLPCSTGCRWQSQKRWLPGPAEAPAARDAGAEADGSRQPSASSRSAESSTAWCAPTTPGTLGT